MNYVLVRDGFYQHYLTHMILSRRVVYFQKHMVYPIGKYMQESHVIKLSSNGNSERILDAIDMQASKTFTENHEVIDPPTGEDVTHPEVMLCVMKKLSIDCIG